MTCKSETSLHGTIRNAEDVIDKPPKMKVKMVEVDIQWFQ